MKRRELEDEVIRLTGKLGQEDVKRRELLRKIEEQRRENASILDDKVRLFPYQ